MTTETPIYTLEDLEEKLKINKRTIREYIKRGEIQVAKIGRRYYVTEDDFMEFINDNKLLRRYL